MTIRKIKEICLYVTDLERTKLFYNGLLKFPIIGYSEGRHIFFRAGESVLLCFIPEVTRNDDKLPPHYAYGHQHLAFECDMEDYDLWKIHVEKSGIPIVHEQGWNNDLRSFYFYDPDGHVLEVIPPGLWN